MRPGEERGEAGADRSDPLAQVVDRLVARLMAEPQGFEFFQAIRLLEAEQARRAVAAGRALPPPVGGWDEPRSEATVRFRSAATLGFPQGAILQVRPLRSEVTAGPEGGSPSRPPCEAVELDLACYGLVGPAGRLPRHYTALVIERFRHHRDRTLHDFLDLFVHRMASLLYRAWGKYRPAVQYERNFVEHRGASWEQPRTSPQDAVTATVGATVGMATRGLGRRLHESDDAVLFHAAHFSRQPRTAEALELLLADLYGTPVEVVPFVGRWLELEAGDQTILPGRDRPEGQHARLGVDAVVGRRVWDLNSTFEVRIGPLTAAAFRTRLPGGDRLAALCDVLRLYAGPQFEIRVRLVLAAAEVPPLRLGAGARLGWTTWLQTGPAAVDRDDAAFRVAG
jgi:type VI secretion system protein ImpH